MYALIHFSVGLYSRFPQYPCFSFPHNAGSLFDSGDEKVRSNGFRVEDREFATWLEMLRLGMSWHDSDFLVSVERKMNLPGAWILRWYS